MKTFLEQARELTGLLKQYKNAFSNLKNENLALKQHILKLGEENRQLRERTETLTRLLVRNHKKISDLNALLVKNENFIRELKSRMKGENGGKPFGATQTILSERSERKSGTLVTILSERSERRPAAPQGDALPEFKGGVKEIERELERQRNKVEFLENMNKKLLIQLQQERFVFNKMASIQKGAVRVIERKFDSKATQKISEVEEKSAHLDSQNPSGLIRGEAHFLDSQNPSGLIRGEATFLDSQNPSGLIRGEAPYRENIIIDLEPTRDVELNDLKAMVNIALQHGNSIESIKNSLINTGYKKEKIEKIIS